MLICQIILAALFGMLRGCKEGQIMIQHSDYHCDIYGLPPGGVRNHDWFRFYHAIGCAKMAVYAALIAVTVMMWSGLAQDVLIVAGILFIIWEFYELSYSVSRWNTLMPESELITFVDLIKIRVHKRGLLIWLHCCRVLWAASFVVAGGIL